MSTQRKKKIANKNKNKNKKSNKNKKKSQTSTRKRKTVKVIQTKCSQQLQQRKKELQKQLNKKKQLSKSNHNRKEENDTSGTEYETSGPENDTTDDDKEEHVEINENDQILNAVFDALPSDFGSDDLAVLDEADIDAAKLIFILKQKVSESVSLLQALTKSTWSGGQIIALKMKYDELYNQTNEPSLSIIANKKNKNNIDTDSDEQLETFDFEFDPLNPNYKQFLVLYCDPNKYERLLTLKRIYWKKRYLIFTELIYLVVDYKKKQNDKNKNKKKGKVFAKDSYGKGPTTLWLRKLHWFHMLLNLKGYNALTLDPKNFERKNVLPSLQRSLTKIYDKNKRKIKKYKYSFDKKFVDDCFNAIGDGWEFIKQIETSENDNDNNSEPNRRGRRKKK